jgi:hypothetical protein
VVNALSPAKHYTDLVYGQHRVPGECGHLQHFSLVAQLGDETAIIELQHHKTAAQQSQ